jgi:hypothetical protein
MLLCIGSVWWADFEYCKVWCVKDEHEWLLHEGRTAELKFALQLSADPLQHWVGFYLEYLETISSLYIKNMHFAQKNGNKNRTMQTVMRQ